MLTDLDTHPTELADTLAALAAAVTARRRRFALHAAAWTLIGVFTAGRLLTQSDHKRRSRGAVCPPPTATH